MINYKTRSNAQSSASLILHYPAEVSEIVHSSGSQEHISTSMHLV